MDYWDKTIDIIQTLILAVTFVGAYFIGKKQNEINNAIARLEDSVELFAYPRKVSDSKWQMMLFNVGKTQLYIISYKVADDSRIVDKALLPAGQQQSAWYVINIPEIEIGQSLSIDICLEDQLGRNWKSNIRAINRGIDEWETSVHKIKKID